jgi:hypothetical protein
MYFDRLKKFENELRQIIFTNGNGNIHNIVTKQFKILINLLHHKKLIANILLPWRWLEPFKKYDVNFTFAILNCGMMINL